MYNESLLEPAPEGTETTDGAGGSLTSTATSSSSGDDTASGGSTSNGTSATTETASSGGGSSASTTSSATTSSSSNSSAGGADGTTSSSTSASTTGSSGTQSTGCAATDCCPDDPDKTEPGDCGCGELETDSDSDGSADCIDLCPDDPQKTDEGECGCGVRDTDSASEAGCLGIKNGLSHRYSFDGTGSTLTDSQGTAHGTVVGTTLSGSGALELATGGADQYAELPSGIVSSLTSVSIEAWFVYETTGSWQRVFDFGSTAEGVAGTPGTGQTYLFFTPKVGNQSGPPRTTFTDNGVDSEVYCAGSGGLARNQTQHVVVSVDTVQHTLSLYLNGTLQSAKAFPGALNTLDDTNNWLGRSQFEVDPLLAGSIEEFRIYSVALTALQASFSYDAGPNPPFLD